MVYKRRTRLRFLLKIRGFIPLQVNKTNSKSPFKLVKENRIIYNTGGAGGRVEGVPGGVASPSPSSLPPRPPDYRASGIWYSREPLSWAAYG